MKTIVHFMVVAVLLSGGMANAAPVLLASWDETAGHASAVTGGVPNVSRVQFVLELSPSTSIPGPRLGMGLFWEDGDHGTVDFTPGSPDEFDEFSALATNGVDDTLSQWVTFPWGSGGGAGYESWRFGGSPDLIGNVVERIRLVVHEVNIEYPWSPPDYPDLEGIRVLADLTYEIYGTPIPEPSTVCLLICGCLWPLCRRNSTPQT